MKKLKVGDKVKVIQGKDRGKVGTIKTILHKKEKIVIDGINTKIKHVKPSRSEEAGKIISSLISMGMPADRLSITDLALANVEDTEVRVYTD